MQDTAKGVKGIVMNEDKFLVLFKPKGEPDLPGGRVEHGEGFLDGLQREIREEAGLEVEIMDTFTHWSFVKNKILLIKGITYNCLYIGGQVALSDEHSSYFWADMDRINQFTGLRRFLESEDIQ